MQNSEKKTIALMSEKLKPIKNKAKEKIDKSLNAKLNVENTKVLYSKKDESKVRGIGFGVLLVFSFFGALFLSLGQIGAVIDHRLPGGEGRLVTALAKALTAFGVFAALGEVNLVYGFFDSLIGFIIGMMPANLWTTYLVSSPVFYKYHPKVRTARGIRNVGSSRLGVFGAKSAIEMIGGFSGALIGAAILYAVTDNYSSTRLGQAYVQNISEGTALVAEIFGGLAFKWGMYVAWGANKSRISGHISRAALGASFAFIGFVISGYSTMSNFNFYHWIVSGIYIWNQVGNPFPVNQFWVFLVGDAVSSILAVVFFFVFHRESSVDTRDAIVEEAAKESVSV